MTMQRAARSRCGATTGPESDFRSWSCPAGWRIAVDRSTAHQVPTPRPSMSAPGPKTAHQGGSRDWWSREYQSRDRSRSRGSMCSAHKVFPFRGEQLRLNFLPSENQRNRHEARCNSAGGDRRPGGDNPAGTGRSSRDSTRRGAAWDWLPDGN